MDHFGNILKQQRPAFDPVNLGSGLLNDPVEEKKTAEDLSVITSTPNTQDTNSAPQSSVNPLNQEVVPTPSQSTNEPISPTQNPENNSNQNIRRALYALKDQVDAVIRLLDQPASTNSAHNNRIAPLGHLQNNQALMTGEKIVEGIFNGERMVGSDGQEYHVPPNYASKSKMVSGDTLKLTITATGNFIYKQIHPAPRRRVMGMLAYDEELKKWTVSADGARHKVLTASVSFYRGEPGNQVILIIPEGPDTAWGAIENIIK